MIPFLRSKTPKYTAFFIQSNLSQAHNVRSYYYFLILQCERSAKHDAFTADFYYCAKRATVERGTMEWWNGGTAENNPKS